MRWIIYIYFLTVFVSCKRENHQVVALINLSSQNIYFIASKNKVLTGPSEVAKVRPITSDPFSEIRVEYEDKEQAESIKHNLFRYKVESDSVETILTSEGVAIFNNSVSIQRIIKDRYNGELHVFIITENDLLKHTDEEIIAEKLYKHFTTLTPEDIKEDSLTLKYF